VSLTNASALSSLRLSSALDPRGYQWQRTPFGEPAVASNALVRVRARAMGWNAHQVVVIDADLGRSGAQTDGRHGFKELVADVGLGKVGIVLGIEVSRLARNNADWYQLLDLCAITDTLIAPAFPSNTARGGVLFPIVLSVARGRYVYNLTFPMGL